VTSVSWKHLTEHFSSLTFLICSRCFGSALHASAARPSGRSPSVLSPPPASSRTPAREEEEGEAIKGRSLGLRAQESVRSPLTRVMDVDRLRPNVAQEEEENRSCGAKKTIKMNGWATSLLVVALVLIGLSSSASAYPRGCRGWRARAGTAAGAGGSTDWPDEVTFDADSCQYGWEVDVCGLRRCTKGPGQLCGGKDMRYGETTDSHSPTLTHF